ncbi:Histidine methyltransferase 1 [Lecanosticta acicola]|uniref:protein-histidine N-methyltransferase n=1 Tax=Lecanosticta acicola TaxID=111012 RepID=A0AAI8YRC6_9PEZI|nr:Histidine methyltransferase 1 [Lecanosticta acicola]
MAFQFGFASNGADSNDDAVVPTNDSSAKPTHVVPAGKSVKQHRLEDLVSTLPERISYSTVRIESPLGRIAHIPRRELFDVRIQLMAEDSSVNDEVIDQIDKSDLRPGIYEGGFKTWECSVDLASLLLDRGPRKDIDELVRCDQIVELGAGTALPSMILFRHAIQNDIHGLTFTFADYNEEVLRLITLPNIILNWAAVTGYGQLDESRPGLTEESKGEFELTPDAISQFLAEMKLENLAINMLSGPWSSTLAEYIPPSAPEMGLVILAAETIYSPESTVAFVSLLSILLKRVKMAKAMIGAKRIYFGVGGSVDGLKEACREEGAVAYEIENHGVSGMDGGVGRALVEVQMY